MQTHALVHNFSNSLLVEARVIEILQQYWDGRGFTDVTKDTAFHSRDVDYVYSPRSAANTERAPHEGPASVWVEMKADSTKHHNFFLELLSNGVYNVDTPGCFMFSQAYAWAYVFEDTKELFLFDLHAVRKWVLANFIELKLYLKTTTNKKSDGTFAPTMGLAIPVKMFLESLCDSVPMAYARLPGFGQQVNGSVPRPRLPRKFAYLDQGLDGLTAMLDSSLSQSAPTRAVQFKPETSPLRRHVLGIKHLALTQTKDIFDSIIKRSLGPHYAELMSATAS